MGSAQIAVGSEVQSHGEAFAATPWQVAMAVGDRINISELGRIPDNVEVRVFFPQPNVLGVLSQQVGYIC